MKDRDIYLDWSIDKIANTDFVSWRLPSLRQITNIFQSDPDQ